MLVLRVNGPAKTVRVRITLIGKGHAVRTVTRTIPTNKRVTVNNLKIAKSVKTVRVSVI